MIIMTHCHKTQQYLQDPRLDVIHILYSDEVQSIVDVHKLNLGLCQYVAIISIFVKHFTSFCHIYKRHMASFCGYLVQ